MQALSIAEAAELVDSRGDEYVDEPDKDDPAYDPEAPSSCSFIDNVSVIPGSLCVVCGGSGTTRLMMTKVPYFRELLLSSFACDDCPERNTEVQFGGEIQEKGVVCSVQCTNMRDLNRQIIKSDTARVFVPCLELEIPPKTQRGIASTIEGVLRRCSKELAAMQVERLAFDVEGGLAVAKIISKLDELADGDAFPFEVRVEDPAGNSFIEPLMDGVSDKEDPKLTTKAYVRTDDDDIACGLRPGGQAGTDGRPDDSSLLKKPTSKRIDGVEALLSNTDPMDREVMTFSVECPHCRAAGDEQMCVAQIPFFKECVIMSFHCAACGYRNAEIKGGGAVPRLGCRASLTCVDERDLSRDLLKSDTAFIEIPELDLQVQQGSLGGIYTTVEGCLRKVRTQLAETNPFSVGDSSSTVQRDRFTTFLEKFDEIIQGRFFPFTIILSDPLANSFVGPRRDALGAAYAEAGPVDVPMLPDVLPPDAQLVVEDYARTWDEDEELGLNDIDTGDDAGKGLGSIAECDDGDDDDAPVVDDVERTASQLAEHVARQKRMDFDETHQNPKPNFHQVDHPNANFARGCDDALPPPPNA